LKHASFIYSFEPERDVSFADYVYVLERSRIAKEGPAKALAEDAEIISTYLG
jgi:ABC-type branched-subunit amino acid transport system ATPase component